MVTVLLMDMTDRKYHQTRTASNKKAHQKVCFLRVEMAGIEPASKRFNPRKSTSVAGWRLSPQAAQSAKPPATIHSSPKALFRTMRDRLARHSSFLTPTRSPGGLRERWTPSPWGRAGQLSTAD